VKVKNQNISGSLGVLLRKLAKSSMNNADGVAVSRETKATRTKKTPRKKTKTVTDVERAVDAMINYQEANEGRKFSAEERSAEIAAVKRGDFSSGYWQQCTQSTDTSLYCIPAHAPFTGQRNYSYPDPAYEPSILTYGEGVETVGNPRLDGMMISGAFRETMYKWKRYTFDLPNEVTIANQETTFFKVWGLVLGSASEQAGRALLSVVMKAWIVDASSTRLNTYEPPTTKPINDWYKYVTPRGVPPYWEATRVLNISRTALAKGYIEQVASCTKAVILVGAAPTKGWRFNNNDNVSCELQPTVEMWQIKKAGWVVGQAPTLTYTQFQHSQIGRNGNRYLFLDAVGVGGSIRVYESTGGQVWSSTPVTTLAYMSGATSCVYAFDKWIAGQDNQDYASILHESADGVAWQSIYRADNPVAVSTFNLMGGVLLSLLRGDDAVYRTTNGTTWTREAVPTQYYYGLVNMTNNGTHFLTIEENGNTCASSTDGVSWTRHALPSFGKWHLLGAIGTRFVAVKYNLNQFAYSDDNGSTWTAGTLPIYNGWQHLVSNGKRIDLFSYNNVTTYLTTTDGINWETKDLPELIAVRNGLGGSEFYISGQTNKSMKSKKG
jgi:hypothetical protein